MVPSINFTKWRAGKNGQAEFAYEFGHACETIGFAVITGHHIAPEFLVTAYECAAKLFSHTDKELMPYAIPAECRQQGPGFVPFGIETALGEKIADQKRYWDIYRERLSNPWPNSLVPQFQPTMLKLFRLLDKLSTNLTQALEIYLKLPEGELQKMIRGSPQTMMRVHHYPPIIGEHQGERGAAHTDLNFLTLLPAATHPGLQVKPLGKEWLPVNESCDSIVVNVGDMLRLVSNERFQSTLHRVVNPSDPGLRYTPRYSLPFFVQPANRTVIVKATGYTAGDYFSDRIAAANAQG